MRRSFLLSLTCAAALLAGCGGGNTPMDGSVDGALPNDAVTDTATDVATDAAPDPLGLANCPSPTPDLRTPASVPQPEWGDAPSLATFCALRGLDNRFAQARVIALGENDHGVEESQRLHALLVRYLAHRHGVRTVALEASAASVALLDRYIHTGDMAALASWNRTNRGTLAATTAIVRHVDELRALVASLPDGASFHLTGFDIEVNPATQTRVDLLAYLGAVEPSELSMWTAALPSSVTTASACNAAGMAAQRLATQLMERRATYITARGEAEWIAAERNTLNLRDGYFFLEYYIQNMFYRGDAAFREPGMFRNVRSLRMQQAERAPLLLIMHNAHAARGLVLGELLDGSPSYSLGGQIDRDTETTGDRYFVLGQLYQEGTHLTRGAARTLESAPFAAPDNFIETDIGLVVPDAAVLFTREATFVPLDAQQDVLSNGYPSRTQTPYTADFNFARRLDAAFWLRTANATMPAM